MVRRVTTPGELILESSARVMSFLRACDGALVSQGVATITKHITDKPI